ncbi:PASTA domain-containing protein, partial [Escherichia coli]|nr:PASTA domain-containing protein [Escherichia coli]
MKDFSGWTEKSVRDYVAEEEFEIAVENEYSDTVEKGLVISQTPKAGSVIKKGDKLTFKVSLGKEEVPPQTVNVQVTI